VRVTENNEQGKGRPTPKRSESQKRRTGPVTPPPTNRREAAKQLRAKQAESRQRIRVGTATGDESAMLPRDKGPVRRAVRDMVDGRRSIGGLLVPIAGIVLVANFISLDAANLAFELFVLTLLIVGLDMVRFGRSVSAAIKKAFPQEHKIRGHVIYGLIRTTQFRRLRRPPPKVPQPPLLKKRTST
jgi:hypothetical protein